MPLGPGTLSGSSQGGGPRPPAGVRPPTTSFGQLRWALRPRAQQPSAPLPQRAGLEGDQVLPNHPPPVPKWVLPYRCHRAQLRVVAPGFSQVRRQGLQTILPPRVSQVVPKTLGQQLTPEENPALWAPLSPPSMDMMPPGLLLHFGQRLHLNQKGFLLLTLK